MAITISGVNDNDKITASDGTLDLVSGGNYAGIITAPAFSASGNLTASSINVGSNIQFGNAGIITATTLVGNVTGNINHTSNLLLQISGSEKFRVGTSGQLGIGGANYGTSGQVLTSGGSGSAATWSTVDTDKITEGNTEAEVVDTGSDGHFKVTTEGTERLRVKSDGTVHFYGNQTTAPEGDFGFRWDRNQPGNLQITNTNNHSVNAGARITLKSNAGNVYASYVNNGGFYIVNSVNGYLHYYQGGTSRFYIKQNGYIAINHTSPTQILDVNGNIKGTAFYGDGANITALNASAISSGTVPVANIGTGSKNSSTFYRGDGTFATVTSTTINNNADNRLITGSGTANTLEGEANLTYVGHTFTAGLTGITPKFVLKRTGAVDSGDNIFSTLQTHDSNGNSMAEITVRRESANDEAYMDFETKATGGTVQGSVRIKGSNGTMYCAGNLGRSNSNQPAYFNDDVYGGTTVPSVLSLRTLTNGGETGLLIRGTSQGGGSSSPHSCIRVDATACGNNADQYGIYTRTRQQLVSDTTSYYGTSYGSYSTTYVFRGHLDKHLGAYTNGYTFHSKITTSHSGGNAYHFRGDDNTTQKIRIELDGDLDNANNSYGGLSDVKLKENIVDAGSQWEDIKAIKVRNYNFKASTGLSTFKQLGVVAQELETVSAGLVKTENDFTIDESTGEGTVTGTTKSVKYSVLYLKALKALQEAQTRIETLESKVAALEGS